MTYLNAESHLSPPEPVTTGTFRIEHCSYDFGQPTVAIQWHPDTPILDVTHSAHNCQLHPLKSSVCTLDRSLSVITEQGFHMGVCYF